MAPKRQNPNPDDGTVLVGGRTVGDVRRCDGVVLVVLVGGAGMPRGGGGGDGEVCCRQQLSLLSLVMTMVCHILLAAWV